MPATKYSIDDARVARALRHVTGASLPQIGKWLGMSDRSVAYQLHHRRNVPQDDTTSERELLLWWLLQRLPAFKHEDRQEEIKQRDIIKRFCALIDEVDEMKHRSQSNASN